MASKRVELAAALAAAGLAEKADELLREEVADVTGLGDRFARFRREHAPRPVTRKRARPGIGRARRKVAAMLCELGFEVEPDGIMCSTGWTRSIHKQHDDTTVTWEVWAEHERDFTIDKGLRTERTERVRETIHLFSWCRLTDCARYGIHVDPLHGHHQQCVTAKKK